MIGDAVAAIPERHLLSKVLIMTSSIQVSSDDNNGNKGVDSIICLQITLFLFVFVAR